MSGSPTRAPHGAGSRIVAHLITGVAPAQPGALIVLAVQLTVGLALATLAVAATALVGHTIPNQQLVFVLCFGVCLPAGIVAGGHLAAALATRLGPSILSALAGMTAAGLLAVVLVARLAHVFGAAPGPALVGGMAAWALAVVALVRRLGSPTRLAARLSRRRPAIWTTTAALAVVALVPWQSLRPGPLALSLLLAAALFLVIARSPRRVPRSLSRVLDAGALALIVLSVVDVSVYLQYLPYDPHLVLPSLILNRARALTDPTFLVFAQQLHHDFYLGPVNDVLHGRPMLVDTYSQYGTGVFYFLAAWFKVAPLGYGPLGLLAGALTALQYAFAYATLRVAGCRPGLATAALVAAIFATVFAAIGSIANFPSTGGLRYLWAYLLVLVTVIGARRSAWARKARAAELAILGISAVWSIEAAVYALAVFVAVAGVEAMTADCSLSARWRGLGRDLAWAIACCLGANLLFALGTLAFAGRWPDWRPYLAFFGVYSGGEVENLRLPLIRAWSPGFGVGALYFASVLAVVTALVRRPRFVRERRATLVAVAACTAFGIVALAYWVGNSDPNVLRVVALPAIMLAALWLGLAADLRELVPRFGRVGALALGLWLASLLVIFGWPQADAKWHRTALYQALPGGASLRSNLRRVWRSPRIDPRSAEAEALLSRHVPAGEPVVVLTEPDLMVETLVRTRRANALPIGDPLEDDLIRRYRLPPVNRAIDRLKPGVLMLTQTTASAFPEGLTPLEHAALAHLRQRFEFQVLETSPSGLSIVRLVLPVTRQHQRALDEPRIVPRPVGQSSQT